jgi:hypothetical protein
MAGGHDAVDNARAVAGYAAVLSAAGIELGIDTALEARVGLTDRICISSGLIIVGSNRLSSREARPASVSACAPNRDVVT